jgi:hypothetical protein
MLVCLLPVSKNKAYMGLTTRDEGYIIEGVLLTPAGDLRNVFNFGGPTASLDTLDATEHVDCLNEWAIRQGATSKYCTLIPSLANHQVRLLNSAGITPELKKQSVIVDLNDRKIRGTTRRLAIKAKESGVIVKAYPPEFIGKFYDMYIHTMDRKVAKDHWYFSAEWFRAFNRFVKPLILLAEYGGEIQSGCLIAHSHQYKIPYYMFQGSYNKFPTLGINHMLILAACEHIKTLGYNYLYLGGGLTDKEDDSLLIFKKGFSKQELPVYTFSKSYLQ